MRPSQVVDALSGASVETSIVTCRRAIPSTPTLQIDAVCVYCQLQHSIVKCGVRLPSVPFCSHRPGASQQALGYTLAAQDHAGRCAAVAGAVRRGSTRLLPDGPAVPRRHGRGHGERACEERPATRRDCVIRNGCSIVVVIVTTVVLLIVL